MDDHSTKEQTIRLGKFELHHDEHGQHGAAHLEKLFKKGHDYVNPYFHEALARGHAKFVDHANNHFEIRHEGGKFSVHKI